MPRPCPLLRSNLVHHAQQTTSRPPFLSHTHAHARTRTQPSLPPNPTCSPCTCWGHPIISSSCISRPTSIKPNIQCSTAHLFKFRLSTVGHEYTALSSRLKTYICFTHMNGWCGAPCRQKISTPKWSGCMGLGFHGALRNKMWRTLL